MGKDLNGSLDNQLFTLMFKRPLWYQHAHMNHLGMQAVMSTYERLMAGYRPRFRDWQVLLPAIADIVRHGPEHTGSASKSIAMLLFTHLIWPSIRIAHLYRGGPRIAGRWGWKEPNSHIYLPMLAGYFPTMRYIHVIRHGLDMTLSQNQAQFINWSSLFGIDSRDVSDEKVLKNRMLEFWVKSNNSAIQQASMLLGDRFLLVNFDAMCDQPVTAIGEICAFLGEDCTKERLAAIATIPRKPSTAGRYQRYAIDDFDPALLGAVRELGFEISDR
jgi:hypothetical protein